ncbi:MAG: DUF1330 domain-containing protein [Pseudomonadales bacterium]|jgi:uncharacterized protein (DUF1330 family)|nr:hypothetical protein [Gammaproteobacteria bacterium]MDP6026348.1 DUF1330 domain-containing protein [Pseudomonadales bacterium]MDP6315891.1 DUF1330 domain-containing protein [Pseudomonadales bacterium]MDP7314243.1 DUF1330 domain-containing protein [Pseudomonadales bacterium]|tara:strand:- start:7564 stop:7854 length:291 start_codon:yes stop_codon:yes gene_type:complete
MSAYLVGDITITDAEAYAEYAKLVPSIIEKHAGRYLVRGGNAEIREGDWEPDRMVVLEFPSKQAAIDFLEDPAYAPVAAIRHANAETRLVLVEGYE